MLHRLLPSSRLNPRGDSAHAKVLCATPVTYVPSGVNRWCAGRPARTTSTPESCAVVREGGREALTGESTGQAIEQRK